MTSIIYNFSITEHSIILYSLYNQHLTLSRQHLLHKQYVANFVATVLGRLPMSIVRCLHNFGPIIYIVT